MCASLLHHFPKELGIFQHRAGEQVVVIEGLSIVISHKNRRFQRLQQRHIPNVGVGIMDKDAGIHIAVDVDMQISPSSRNASATNSPSF